METIQKQLQKLHAIHSMIESCKFRIKHNIETCKSIHGLNENGNIVCTDIDLERHEKYAAILKRLKASYNNQLDKMSKYGERKIIQTAE